MREPEANGVAKRFIHTLKERLPWVQHFETVDEMERGLQALKQRYNQQWLVAKHDYRTPQHPRAMLALGPAA